jgi:diguanylate cyclase (GGDEF)-like protein
LDRLAVVRQLFAPSDDPYAGADLANAKRLGAVLCLMAAGITVVLLPFTPPTRAVGDAGWLVVAALALGSFGAVKRFMGDATSFRRLLVACYTGIAAIGLMQWLAGGHTAPYEQLYLLAFICCAATHPPRLAAICIGAGSLALLLPLSYDYFAYGALVSDLTQLLIWWGMCLVTMILMNGVRATRLAGQAASREARVDSLTGLGNRRAFEEAVTTEAARADRNGMPVSLLMADLDGFKQINDTYGHTAGDDCLRKVAEAFRLAVRAGDLCFRWGGDEFVALLPGTGLHAAERVRERLEATVRAAGLGPGDEDLTISCGVSQLDEISSADGLVASADMELLLAKRDSQRVT